MDNFSYWIAVRKKTTATKTDVDFAHLAVLILDDIQTDYIE
jgi:hypothetical protein